MNRAVDDQGILSRKTSKKITLSILPKFQMFQLKQFASDNASEITVDLAIARKEEKKIIRTNT